MNRILFVLILFTISSCSRFELDSDGLVIPDSDPIVSKSIDGVGSYKGQMAGDLANGYGVMKYLDGSIYSGNWLYGSKHGLGKYIDPYECVTYEGSFHNDATNGVGVIEFREVGSVSGVFETNKWPENAVCDCDGRSFKCDLGEFVEYCLIPSTIEGTISSECRGRMKKHWYQDHNEIPNK
jgi:hypothetical protein